MCIRDSDWTDGFTWNRQRYDSWRVILVIGTRFAEAAKHFLADVVAAVTRLGQCFTQLLETQSLDFDVHLARCDAVLCPGHLEVHIAQVVFIPQDIGEYNILARVFR